MLRIKPLNYSYNYNYNYNNINLRKMLNENIQKTTEQIKKNNMRKPNYIFKNIPVHDVSNHDYYFLLLFSFVIGYQFRYYIQHMIS